jgi:3-oxoadipate enol-lactonase
VESFRHDGIELYYEILGEGPDVVLLHPFPSCHEFWLPVAQKLATRHRVVVPDLRAHGRSGVPDRPAVMADHASDIEALCRRLGIQKAIFGGISIGGYVLFEFWRRFPQRVKGLGLFCTKASADTAEARAARLQSAEQALERGAAQFIDSMIPKLLGATTLRNRKDIESAVRATMRLMTPQGIAMTQRGMAERPDSIPTLATIAVATLIVGGEEDALVSREELERMRDAIRGSEMAIIAKAGHYAALEAPDEFFRVLRNFCERVSAKA